MDFSCSWNLNAHYVIFAAQGKNNNSRQSLMMSWRSVGSWELLSSLLNIHICHIHSEIMSKFYSGNIHVTWSHFFIFLFDIFFPFIGLIDSTAEDVTGNGMRETCSKGRPGHDSNLGPPQRGQSLCTWDACSPNWAKRRPTWSHFIHVYSMFPQKLQRTERVKWIRLHWWATRWNLNITKEFSGFEHCWKHFEKILK